MQYVSLPNGKEHFRSCIPLLAGVAVAGKPITSPDGARTTPGWATLTGPSRPIMSLSLVLLALKQKVDPDFLCYLVLHSLMLDLLIKQSFI